MHVSSHPYSPDDIISIGEAARLLSVSLDTLRRWDDEGKLAATRTPGGQRRYRRGDVEALLPRPSRVAS